MRGRPRKLLLNGALVVVIAGVGVASYLSFSGGNGGASQADTASAAVTRGTVRSTVSASGTVVSPRTLTVDFATGGTVTRVEVHLGEHVTKGQELARVDASGYQTDLLSAEAGVISAEAGLTTAEASLASAEANLTEVKKNDPSDAQLAQAQAQVTSARAQIDQAQASIASARAQVSQAQATIAGTVLDAPMTGTVISVNGAVGDTVSSGGVSSASSSSTSSSNGTSGSSGSSSNSGFIELSDLDHLQVRAYFSETDTAKLEVGQQASVSLNAIPGTRVRGKVVAIDPTSTTVNQVVDYGITLELRKPPKDIRVGQTADVVIVTGRARDVLTVPSAAVATSGGQDTVTVLRDGRQVSTVVQIGLQGDQTTEIVSGLPEGERVVIASSSTGSNGFPFGGFPGGAAVRIGTSGPGD